MGGDFPCPVLYSHPFIMAKITYCSGTYPVGLDQSLDVFGKILSVCSPWRLASKKTSFLGRGSYGAVHEVVLRKGRGAPKKVALKVVRMGKKGGPYTEKIKSETIAEIEYGRKMSSANIGPKIYDAFIYTEKNPNFVQFSFMSERGIFEYGFIIMEKFQGSGSQFLWDERKVAKKRWGRYITPRAQEIVIKKMMALTRRMVSKNLYCWDIKPGNFVVNFKGAHAFHVRMIDFGGQFCVFGVKEREHYLRQLRRSSKKLSTITIPQFNELFYCLIMIPFLIILNNLIAHRQVENSADIRGAREYKRAVPRPYVPFDLHAVALPLMKTICNPEKRSGMIELLKSNSVIFKTFYHYTRDGAAVGWLLNSKGFMPLEPPPLKMVGLYFNSRVDQLCDDLKHLPTRSSRKTRKRH
jgi:hypothetical protein